MQSIMLPFLPITMNEIIDVTRTSVPKAFRLKKQWTQKVADATEGVIPIPRGGYIVCEFFVRNQQRDSDNLQATKKVIFDGLKKAGRIEDDSLSHLNQHFSYDRFHVVGSQEHEGVTLHCFQDFGEAAAFVTRDILSQTGRTQHQA